MSGHLKATCYFIYGCPSWHKSFGKPKPKPKFFQQRPSVVANVSQAPVTESVGGYDSVSAGLHVSDGFNLTDYQCKQLIQLP